MYTPKHFEEKDLNEIEQLVREFGFGTLVTIKDGLPVATHTPMELEKAEAGWVLHGHIARANQQWKSFENNSQVLAIFMGPHTYISPSWYNHKNVPTWNYKAAHLYGKIEIITGEKLLTNLGKLMARYEKAHAEKPLDINDVPENIMQGDLRALVGFEIKVERIEAASKLSQNRDAESYQSIIGNLEKLDAYDAERIAEEMKKRK